MVELRTFQHLQLEQQINMSDLQIIENGDGGDAVLNGNDLSIIDGFQNMPYLGMFGGNVDKRNAIK